MVSFDSTLQFPTQMMHPLSRRMERVLLVCAYDTSTATGMTDALARIQANASFAVVVVNLKEYHTQSKRYYLPSFLDLSAFEGVVVHESALIGDLKLGQCFVAFSGAKVLLSEQPQADCPKLSKHFQLTRYDANVVMKDASQLDNTLMQCFQEKARVVPAVFCSEAPAKNILLLAGHAPVKDPRLSWVSDFAPEALHVIQLGVNDATSETIVSYRQRVGTHFYRQHVPEALDEAVLVSASKTAAGALGVQVLLSLHRMLTLSERALSHQYAMPYQSMRYKPFMWYIGYFCRVTERLLAEALQMRGLHAVVASDLPTLIAALILKGLFDIPVLYDAHEYWPEQDVASFEFEKQFWRDMEKQLLEQVDYCQTVSSTLAALMTSRYQKPFESVPNCIPLADVPNKSPNYAKDTEVCRFVFQGGFAKGRGIEHLIRVWPKVRSDAHLLLRGPESSFKQQMIVLAQQTGLLNQRIFFLPAVAEDELVNALNEADVGLIPYEPILANNTNCCPNKLSQYFAAQLPVLSNNTAFLQTILDASKAGCVVDFTDESALIEAIHFLIQHPDEARVMGVQGYQFLQAQFHWEAVSTVLYAAMNQLTAHQASATFSLYHQPTRVMIRLGLRERLQQLKVCAMKPFWKLWHLMPDTGGPSLLRNSKQALKRFFFIMSKNQS
ncbi:MAG: glycosyltransferase family 4 protein [Legionellaceae bacterium]|nr:glycosyltransferase family 4 protein [Legionellaceae bacterium]